MNGNEVSGVSCKLCRGLSPGAGMSVGRLALYCDCEPVQRGSQGWWRRGRWRCCRLRSCAAAQPHGCLLKTQTQLTPSAVQRQIRAALQAMLEQRSLGSGDEGRLEGAFHETVPTNMTVTTWLRGHNKAL